MSNSIGNLKNTGLKGNNWPWQYKMLLGLDKIAASIVTGGKEYEAELVNISCSGPVPPAGDIVRLEIRIFDTVTGGFTSVQYYEPGSTTPDPADYSGCTVTYITGGGGTAGGATEATQLLVDTSTSTLATPVTGLGMTLGIFSGSTGITSAGKRSISILNSGANTATVGGGTPNNLPPGVEVTWEAGGLRDTLGVLTWDATGTTLIISTVG